MTTVCYRDGILVTDSMVSANGAQVGSCSKLRCFKDGSVAAHGGVLADAEQFFAWVEEGESKDKKPELDERQFEAVRVWPDGKIAWYNHKCQRYSYRESMGFFAFGTGESFAMGAMAAGATAEEACRIACQFDTTSAEPLCVERLKILEEAAD